MSRYQGYSDSLEVLIDILNEMREIKELLKTKEPKEAQNEQIQNSKRTDNRSTSRSGGVHKPKL